MNILKDFNSREHFIGNRKMKKHSPRQYRLWRNRIMAFLAYCAQQNIFRISDIRQPHYDGFIAHISKNRSPATIADWKYALNKFFQRAHLDIQVQTSPGRQQAKRLSRARKKLMPHFDATTTDTIVRLLRDLF